MNISSSQGTAIDQSLCVAYILRRFPVLTHTFVTSEILALRQMGVRVPVFSLLGARDSVRSASSQEVCAKDVYYPRMISPTIISSQVRALVADPHRYLQAVSAIADIREMGAGVVARAIALFPKCVAIGIMCKRMGVSHIHTHWPGLPVFGAQVTASICNTPFSFTIHTPQDAKLPGLEKQVSKASFVRCDTRLGQQLVSKRVPSMAYRLRMVRTIKPSNYCDVSTADGGYMLVVARLVPKKGIIYLLQACSLLEERGVDFRCVVIGDGPLHADLVQEAVSLGLESKVDFVGALSYECTHEWIAKCSFLVMPSVEAVNDVDGLPTVILEATSAGKPVIATSVAAIPEIILDGYTGLVVPQRDVEGLADALERLLANPELRRTLGKNALALSQQEFDHQKAAAQLLNLFRDYSVRIG